MSMQWMLCDCSFPVALVRAGMMMNFDDDDDDSNTEAQAPHHHHHHNRFLALFLGPPGWAGARRELLDFMVEGKINKGRHTDHPAGGHPIQTNQRPPLPSPILFYRLDALPATRPTVSKHKQCNITAENKPMCNNNTDTLPSPYVFVGVLTQIKISWASRIACVMFVEKKRFLLRHSLTTSSNPGCKTEYTTGSAIAERPALCSTMWTTAWTTQTDCVWA